MQILSIKILSLFTTFFLVAQPAFASPKDFLQAALENNLEYRQSVTDIQITEQRVVVANAYLLPQISSSGSYRIDTPPKDKNGTRPDRTTAQIVATQQLVNIGLINGVAVADEQLVLANHNADITRQSVFVATYQAYMSASLAKENIGLLEKRQENLLEQLKVASSSFEVGKSTKLQVLSVQAQLAALEAERISADNNLANAIDNLEHLSGIYAGTILRLEFVPTLHRKDTQYWLNKVNKSPAVKAAQARVNIQIKTSEQLFSTILPSISVQGIANKELKTRFSLNLSVPLYSSGRATAIWKGSQLTEQSLAVSRQALLDAKKLQVQIALRDFEQQTAREQALSVQVELEQERLELAQASIELESGILADALNATSDLASAELQLAQTRHALLQAWLDLHSAAGMLTLENFDQTYTLFR